MKIPEERAGSFYDLTPRRAIARTLFGWLIAFGFAETDLIAEGVEEVELVRIPKGFRDAGTPVGVVLCAQLGVEFADAFIGDLEVGAGRSVTVVLGEMKDETIAGDLHIEWRGGLEAVLPVEVEAGVVEIKLARFLDGEYAQDGDDLKGARAHGS
jgi:hypothetical protein